MTESQSLVERLAGEAGERDDSESLLSGSGAPYIGPVWVRQENGELVLIGSPIRQRFGVGE